MYTLSSFFDTDKNNRKGNYQPSSYSPIFSPPSSSAAILYDQTTMSKILEEAQLEAPASSLSQIGDKGRLSTKALLVIVASLWHMLLHASSFRTRRTQA